MSIVEKYEESTKAQIERKEFKELKDRVDSLEKELEKIRHALYPNLCSNEELLEMGKV